MTCAPNFIRKKVLEDMVNRGQSLEGLSGFVSGTIKCCSGSTRFYTPVTLVGVEIGDCSFKVIARAASEDDIVLADKFSINPLHFFSDKEEVERYEDYLNRRKMFNSLDHEWDYSTTATKRRHLFQAALNRTKDRELNAELQQEIQDEGGLSKMDKGWIATAYKKLLTIEYFPREYNQELLDSIEEDAEFEDDE